MTGAPASPRRILVTGATGFVGSHAADAFLRAGHHVRLLVRSPDRLAPTVLGDRRGDLDVVRGDMCDPDSVAAALDGVDAVLHAAGVVGVSRADAGSRDVNLEGARTVLGAAVTAGCDPILYTGSVSALLPSDEPVLTVDSPLARPPGDYSRSKVDAERYARTLQRDGAPVVSFLIGGVYGPVQPDVASGMEGIVAAASQMMVVPDGGVGTIDVRDLSALFVAALEPGRGPRRYMAGGQYLTWAQWTDLLSEVVGRRVRRVRVPNPALRGLGRTLDAAKRVRNFDYPLTYEAAVQMTSSPRTDDSATLADLGVRYRPVRETLEDATRWLVESGHLDLRHAPALAGAVAGRPGPA
jgi:nucleoside-diphosphate-sugar epimerase